ncbi:MAG: ABC transporter ATP-binding protein [Clostridia bacterium]|nr:ABC transporter ATP-binding protein [Clostridia bacterium]
MAAIEIKNLTKIYGKIKANDDISLSVNKGEIYGFIGKNGAGKSTTIRILLNFNYATSGSATILGYDCARESKKIKEFTAYVPGEVYFYPEMKVKDLLNYSIALNSNENRGKARELCEYFELSENRYIKELSLGNRKKVSLVQALMKDSSVMIFDEPTNGLDPLIQEKLFTLLLEKKKKGATIFLSSHNLFEVEKYCDRVCIIKDGKIVLESDMETMNKARSLIVSFVTAKGAAEKFDYEGDINSLTKKLAEKDLVSLEIKHSSLEEKFMSYYGEDK